jgi:serine/threonine protein kinase
VSEFPAGTVEGIPGMANETCGKCGAEIFAQISSCAACLLETGLDSTDQSDNGNASHQPVRTDFGDYELLEEIGRGGQGVVYRARQRSLNRVVALKVIALGHWATEVHLRRFRLEAETIASLDQPGIVPIYEAGEHDGHCYFTMKFIEGERLDQVVKNGSMSIPRAGTIMAELARTVNYAHEHGVLHRDIKPGNVLIDTNGKAHLTDFGLAKLIEKESTITNTHDLLGTPSYMAPEQITGTTELTSATDIYGLGAVLFETITGRPPFLANAKYELIRQVLESEPPRPRSLNPKVDIDLETICLKCLEKEPARRYSSALALAEDLDRWLRKEPVQARRSGILIRGRKLIQRHPVLAAVAPLMAALVAIAAVLFWKNAAEQLPTTGVAVLPFENLSEDKENAYLVDGIQDEILTRLSKIADLKVISRTSTQNYKSRPANLRDIGRQLGVAHVLEGSVQKSGELVRVNVQLIKAANGSHLWADTYDRRQSDIFTVETEVARAIADQLRAKLSGQERQVIADKPTDNPEAYDAYLRGLAYSLKLTYVPANALAAQKYLRESVRLDPKFALSWALLSYVDAREYITRNLEPTLALREETQRAAETALTLQPNLGEAVLAKGYYYYACQKDYKTAERYYEQARQLLPNSSHVPNCWPTSRGGKAGGTRASRISTKPSGLTRAAFIC